MKFQEKLKELRQEAKLTQKQVADYFNISQSAYAQWETGKINPKKETIQKFADFFNVSTDYLLGKSDVKNPNEKSELELLIEQLDEEQKEETITFIQNLIKEK